MRRVIFKTIVSTRYELPYVLLNLLELNSVCDEFWITEANCTNTGEEKALNFLPLFQTYIQPHFPKAKFIAMDISRDVKVWTEGNLGDSELRWNEFLTRSRFIEYVEMPQNRDVVISVDGDEVIYDTLFLRLTLIFMKLWPFKKPVAFLLTLRQFMFYLNLYMTEYDFYSPTVAHAQFYLAQSAPHWRGGGKRIKRPFGGHFSWVMTTEEMKLKILSYSHRDRLNHLASLETLTSIKQGSYNIFEPNRSFGACPVTTHRNRVFPKNLKKVKAFFSDQLVLGHEMFWD
jgi:hypothetical protein